jgi:exonuclease VII large subunit
MKPQRDSIASALQQLSSSEPDNDTTSLPDPELEQLKRKENRKITQETLAEEAQELQRRHVELVERLQKEIRDMEKALAELKPLAQELQEERPDTLRPQDTERLRQFKRKIHMAHMELMKLDNYHKHHQERQSTLIDQPAGKLLKLGFLLSFPLMLLIIAAVVAVVYELRALFN